MVSDIPKYNLESFRKLHRSRQSDVPCGHNQPNSATNLIEGFELYSTSGIAPTAIALTAEFYRMSITVKGSFDMQVGLNSYSPGPGTLVFTSPSQVFSKTNLSTDISGYYLLFDPHFLSELVPAIQLVDEFPFFDRANSPVFEVSTQELNAIISLLMKINDELNHQQTGRHKAIKMYLYLVLLEAKRSYERQQIDPDQSALPETYTLVNRFKKLVARYFLTKRHVSAYAQLLGVSANHLNKTVKEHTGQTASDSIRDMLVREAKSLLLYTDQSVAQIAYRLDFSSPAAFHRFFKTSTGQTPLIFRNRYD